MPGTEQRDPESAHVVIIGAMGSGKTTLARSLAAALGREFLDSDISIRARTGRSGREIAEADAVDALHELERRVLFDALDSPTPVVVAAAASVIEDRAVRDALDDTYCVWVSADPEILAERAAQGTHRRAVAESEHLEHRNTLYEGSSDLMVDTGAMSPEESVARVLAAMKREQR